MSGQGCRFNPNSLIMTETAKKRYKLIEKWKKEREAGQPPKGFTVAILERELGKDYLKKGLTMHTCATREGNHGFRTVRRIPGAEGTD